MADVLVFERAAPTFAAGLPKRGPPIVFRGHASHHRPRRGRPPSYVGRIRAECGFCGTAVPLAETAAQEATPRSSAGRNKVSDQRRFPRMTAKNRKLQLLVD